MSRTSVINQLERQIRHTKELLTWMEEMLFYLKSKEIADIKRKVSRRRDTELVNLT